MSNHDKCFWAGVVVLAVIVALCVWMPIDLVRQSIKRVKEIEARRIAQSDKYAGDMDLTVFDLHGHTYIIASGTYKADMLHAAHCQCKTNPPKTE